MKSTFLSRIYQVVAYLAQDPPLPSNHRSKQILSLSSGHTTTVQSPFPLQLHDFLRPPFPRRFRFFLPQATVIQVYLIHDLPNHLTYSGLSCCTPPGGAIHIVVCNHAPEGTIPMGNCVNGNPEVEQCASTIPLLMRVYLTWKVE